MDDADIAVLLFGDQRARRCGPLSRLRRSRANQHLPRPLRGLPVADAAEIDAAARDSRRLIVVGLDADLATVLTRLLRIEKLDVEIGFVPPRRSAATRVYRLPVGRRAARRARRGSAGRIPLIRDETGSAIVGVAYWRPPGDRQLLHGEAVVDDTVLFDGDVTGVRVEPTAALPGLRASVLHRRPRRWVTGRAAQLGTTGAVVVRDGVPAAWPVRRATFYRHTQGWLLVR